MYQIKLVNDFNDYTNLKEKWDDILNEAIFNSFFCCYEWISSWWLCFSSPDDKLTLVLAEYNGKLVAIAPLMIRRKKEYGFRLNVLQFIGVPNADRCDMIVRKGEDAVLPELAEFILKKVNGWDQLHLNEVPAESLFSIWLQENKSMVYVENGSECPYVSLAEFLSWDDYFKTLSKSTRKKVKHNFNRLNKSGDIKVDHLLLTRRDDAIFRQAEELERTSEKARRISNLGLVGEQNNLFQENLLQQQGQHQVMLSILKKDNGLIAYNYGYLYNNVYYFYNTAFADKEKINSPGMLIFKEVLCYLMDKGIDEIDCLRGATVNKKRWAKRSRIQQNIYLLKNRPINWSYALVVFKFRPFLKRNILPLLQRLKNTTK